MFIENINNKDQFFKYMFFYSGKVSSTWDKEPPVTTTRKELKKKNRRRLDKKREIELLILNKRLNNTQLLTNSYLSSKHFILFKLFLPRSKSINLAFLLTNLP